MLHSTGFWVLLATLIFAVVAYKKGRGPILALLDARTARIKSELEEAERLRIEAQNLLADIQQKHRDAVATADKIVASARENAARLQDSAAQKLKESLDRREAQLLDRIARAEASAIQELQTQAADIAAKSAEILLVDAAAKRGAKLVDEAIADIKLN